MQEENLERLQDSSFMDDHDNWNVDVLGVLVLIHVFFPIGRSLSIQVSLYREALTTKKET